jgi:hypothetical protein
MTVLKWLLIVVSVGYVGGLVALFLLQRSLLFPIPSTMRTAPAAVGFPLAEEHLLTTADGEKVIVWHVPARPGHPVVLYFHGNGDFLAGFFGRFRNVLADGTGIVALSYRGYAGSSGKPSEQGLLQDAAAAYAFTMARYDADQIVAWGFSLGSGVRRRAAGRQADPGGVLHVDCRRCRGGVSDLPDPSRHAGSFPFRRAHRTGESSAPDHARRARPHDTDWLWRAPVRARA